LVISLCFRNFSKLSSFSLFTLPPFSLSYPTPYPVPLTPAMALKSYSHLLTPFEQSEILEHQHVYFLGNTPNKVQGMPQAPSNNGMQTRKFVCFLTCGIQHGLQMASI
jgi:hypothetical protein